MGPLENLVLILDNFHRTISWALVISDLAESRTPARSTKEIRALLQRSQNFLPIPSPPNSHHTSSLYVLSPPDKSHCGQIALWRQMDVSMCIWETLAIGVFVCVSGPVLRHPSCGDSSMWFLQILGHHWRALFCFPGRVRIKGLAQPNLTPS